MAHHALRTSYDRLTRRLNRFPQGAPPGRLLYSILRILFDQREAELVSLLPIKPFTAEKAARIWKMKTAEARHLLDALASRALLVDIDDGACRRYALPPPMAGFFEFSLMRVRGDIDQKLLSELFYEYLNVEEDFIRELFTEGDTQLGRVFVHEPALPAASALHVLDYERASEVIRSAVSMAVGICYCRHKMTHLDRACKAPLDICMTFNTTARSLIRHGHARQVESAEGLDLLQRAYDQRLVQFGENVRQGVNFICNCCGCCCEAMIAARRFAVLQPVHTTGFFPRVAKEACNGCGKCVEICPVEAAALVSTHDPQRPKRKMVRVDPMRCLGCGVCVRICSTGAMMLEERQKRLLTPMNTSHRAVVMALERGKLQDLIFDNRVLFSHRALAAVLGVILRLPPVKRTLATDQVKSRYLEALVARVA